AAKPGGAQVRWVCADARGLDLGGHFDLVVMTCHAFQCFLTDEDRVALLATIARHLAPEGLFLFDSRNPSCAEWQGWTPEATREIRPHPTLGPLESWNDVVWDASRAVATYQTFYRPVTGDQCFQAHSAIGFTNQSRLASLIDAAGLRVDRWLGGWDGAPFTPEAAEIIPLGGLAL
ncbi:MAG: class I SAM-dependent methyltransferase, partial [Rhodobacteraceae bacterium]|nr:class I SAM-dependent methyltransferase [Paracoccaceae bacterium]